MKWRLSNWQTSKHSTFNIFSSTVQRLLQPKHTLIYRQTVWSFILNESEIRTKTTTTLKKKNDPKNYDMYTWRPNKAQSIQFILQRRPKCEMKKLRTNNKTMTKKKKKKNKTLIQCTGYWIFLNVKRLQVFMIKYCSISSFSFIFCQFSFSSHFYMTWNGSHLQVSDCLLKNEN